MKDPGLRLDTRKKFFAVRLMRHWHRLPRKVVAAPGTVQGQAGWGFAKPALVGGVRGRGREIGAGCSLRSVPTQNGP